MAGGCGTAAMRGLLGIFRPRTSGELHRSGAMFEARDPKVDQNIQSIVTIEKKKVCRRNLQAESAARRTALCQLAPSRSYGLVSETKLEGRGDALRAVAGTVSIRCALLMTYFAGHSLTNV